MMNAPQPGNPRETEVRVREIKAILEHVKGIEGLADRLGDEADIVEEVGLDSLEMMEFMLETESRLAIEIDFERLDFDSLHSIRRFVDSLAHMGRNP